MTGWTQFTARFEEEQHADAIVEDANKSDELRITYAESLGDIARVRILDYHMEDEPLGLLEAAGPIEAVMVANFNDTSDSGEVKLYLPERGSGWASVAEASCPEASRWNFRHESCGLVETGTRAGNDFSLEEEYGKSDKEVIPLEEIERIADDTLEMLKIEATVEAEEYAQRSRKS